MMCGIHSDPELLVEPTLDELLADPIVRMIMRRDGVDERDMRNELDRVRDSYRPFAEVQ